MARGLKPTPVELDNRKESGTMKSTSSSLLRNTLRADAAVCAVAGIDLVAFSGMAADLVGLRPGATLPMVGIGLIAYAAYLLVASRREPLSLNEAWAFATADLLWVAGSAALIAFGPLGSTGNWIVGAVAVVTLGFAELKMLGIRRIRLARGMVFTIPSASHASGAADGAVRPSM
jgi:hypothetical protein